MAIPNLSPAACLNFVFLATLPWEDANKKNLLKTPMWNPQEAIPIMQTLMHYVSASQTTLEETRAYNSLLGRIKILNEQTEKLKTSAPSTVTSTASAPSTPSILFHRLALTTPPTSSTTPSTPRPETKEAHS